MQATVLNQMHWDNTVSQNRLKNIVTEALGPRHNPVNHGDALSLFKERLGNNNINIQKETGLLSKDAMKYVYVAEVADTQIPDYGFTLGFVNFNNMKKAFTGLFGERVFVCSNEMFKGETMSDNKRHTTNVWGKLEGKMDSIIERFNIFRDERVKEIDLLKNFEVSDKDAGEMILNIHRDHILTNSNITKLVHEWDHPTHKEFNDRTLWSFSNVCTEVAKNIIDPTRRIDTTNQISNLITAKIAA